MADAPLRRNDSAAPLPGGPGVDPGEFRRAVGRFATGVTVLTTTLDGRPLAMTANSFTSVSLDPVLVLVSIRQDATFHAPVVSSRVWGVSVLPAEMAGASHLFAARDRHDGARPFSQWRHSFGPRTGVLLFDDALACFECQTVAAYPAGDHTLLVGEVVGLSEPADEAEPLVFFRGGYRRLAADQVEPEDRPAG